MAPETHEQRLRQIKEDAQAFIREMPECEKLVRMYEEMLIAREMARSDFMRAVVEMDAGRAAIYTRAGVTLLGEISTSFDRAAAARLFARLKEIASRHGQEFAAQVGKIDAGEAAGRLDPGAVLEDAFRNSSGEESAAVADGLGFDRHFFAMLVSWSVRPALEAYGGKLRNLVDESQWEKPQCPVCGRMPYIARLEGEEGRKVLCCPGCAAAWRYPRLMCANCATRDQKSLRILYPEGAGRERYAEVCDRCGKYLKVIDARKLARMPVMELADAGTVHIDLLAGREGFAGLY